MTVYVDDVEHKFGRMKMCHLWADDIEELQEFADKIGMRRAWFQKPPKASWCHYDISLTKKREALALGAVLTDRFGPSEHTAKLAIASGIPERVARGEKMLSNIAYCRALRDPAPAPEQETLL